MAKRPKTRLRQIVAPTHKHPKSTSSRSSNQQEPLHHHHHAEPILEIPERNPVDIQCLLLPPPSRVSSTSLKLNTKNKLRSLPSIHINCTTTLYFSLVNVCDFVPIRNLCVVFLLFLVIVSFFFHSNTLWATRHQTCSPHNIYRECCLLCSPYSFYLICVVFIMTLFRLPSPLFRWTFILYRPIRQRPNQGVDSAALFAFGHTSNSIS